MRRRRPLLGLVVLVALLTASGNARAELEFALGIGRLGFADRNWTPMVVGPGERLLGESRYRAGARVDSFAVSWSEPGWLLDVAFLDVEDYALRERSVLRWDGTGFAAGVGVPIPLGFGWRLTPLLGGRVVAASLRAVRLAVGLDLDLADWERVELDRDLTYLQGWGALRIGWALPGNPLGTDLALRLNLQLGWSEVKPLRIAPLGRLDVGGFDAGFAIGVVFGGGGPHEGSAVSGSRPPSPATASAAPPAPLDVTDTPVVDLPSTP